MLGAADASSLAGLAFAFFTLAAAWRMQLRRRRTRSEMK
jgi:hypothetical protein